MRVGTTLGLAIASLYLDCYAERVDVNRELAFDTVESQPENVVSAAVASVRPMLGAPCRRTPCLRDPLAARVVERLNGWGVVLCYREPRACSRALKFPPGCARSC